MTITPYIQKVTSSLVVSFSDKQVVEAQQLLISSIKQQKIILTAGNGGSAAQASHLAGELVGRYKRNRKPFQAICLSSDISTMTCIANDYGYEEVFSRQVRSFNHAVILPIFFTTSGKSPNILKAIEYCTNHEIRTIVITGQTSPAICNPTTSCVVNVNSTDTGVIQQAHLLLLHYFCELIEEFRP